MERCHHEQKVLWDKCTKKGSNLDKWKQPTTFFTPPIINKLQDMYSKRLKEVDGSSINGIDGTIGVAFRKLITTAIFSFFSDSSR